MDWSSALGKFASCEMYGRRMAGDLDGEELGRERTYSELGFRSEMVPMPARLKFSVFALSLHLIDQCVAT